MSWRSGERIQVLSVNDVSHYFARAWLTFAAAGGKGYVLDLTTQDLKARLGI